MTIIPTMRAAMAAVFHGLALIHWVIFLIVSFASSMVGVVLKNESSWSSSWSSRSARCLENLVPILNDVGVVCCRGWRE